MSTKMYRNCKEKSRLGNVYPTEDRARNARLYLLKKKPPGARIEPFRCPICEQWHLGGR